MSLKIDRILHTLKEVSHDFSKAVKQTQAPQAKGILTLPKTIYIPKGKLVLPTNLASQDVQSEKQINYEEIEFLIEALQEIAGERTRKPFGFRPDKIDTIDKNEEALTNKAAKLEQKLWDYPSQANVKAAKKFIKVISVVNALEDIAKNRNGTSFGFNKTSQSKNDIKLADKAINLATELKTLCIEETASKKDIKPALEFMALVDIIGELEYIAKENSRTSLGFKQNPPDENEENVQEIALKLAETLKEKFDPVILKAAIKFLELAQAFTEINKTKKAINGEQNECAGFHCSFEEEIEPDY